MSTPQRIYLVRHGEAAASWGESPDPGLSALGQQQARAVGERLAAQLETTPTTLMSSPLKRARETATPLIEATGLGLAIDERFREIPSPVPLAQRQDWLRGFMRSRWSEQDDSLHDWRARIVRAVQECESPTVVFTHFLVINALVGWAQQRDDTLVFWPDNASVTVLAAAGDTLAIESLGEQMPTRVN